MKQKLEQKLKKDIWSKYYYLFISVFVLFLIGLLVFSYIQLDNASKEISERFALLNRYTLEESKISKLLQDHESVEDQVELLNNAIPDKEKFVGFIESIEDVGDILGVDISINMRGGVVDEEGVVVDVESESTKRVSSYSKISSVEALEVGVTMRTGSEEFDKVINFVGMLEDLKYYSKIIDFKVMNGLDDDGKQFLDTVLTLNLYVKSGGKDE